MEIDKYLHEDFKQNLTDVIAMVHLMFYDQPPKDFHAGPEGPRLKEFKQILEAARMVFPERQISMVFEPGTQANGGVWEGLNADKDIIDWMRRDDGTDKDKGPFGGASFWSMNDKVRGPNAQKLAEYIQTH